MDHQLKAKIAILEAHKRNNWDIDNNVSFGENLTIDNVLTVSFMYTLGNWKGTFIVNDGGSDYYEVTYNVDKGEMYVDWYRKMENILIKDDPIAKLRERLMGDAR